MIKELERFETSFEDDTFWVMYEDENGRIGYEIVENEDTKINPKKDKILIEELEDLENEILQLEETENDMLYLEKWEFEEDDNLDEYLEIAYASEKVIKKYPHLDCYIEVWENEGDERIVFYGGLIAEILFKKEGN